MRKIIYLFLLLSTTTFANTITSQKSVVKVFATISLSNYAYPYQTAQISKFTGSGAIISHNRILTSSHVVSGARFIEIQKENDPKKYVATVKYISNQADLAILKVRDESFFTDTSPLKISEEIKTRDEVTVLGYPLGGNTVSTTTGVVSRIEYRNYVWSGSHLLAIQIDAAINAGNSGGPVVNDKNELVGIAMMKLTNTSNIAYIVPSIIINTFLEDVKEGVVNGFHSDSIVTQNINNDAQKKLYGFKKRSGVLISYVGGYISIKGAKAKWVYYTLKPFAIKIKVYYTSLISIQNYFSLASALKKPFESSRAIKRWIRLEERVKSYSP